MRNRGEEHVGRRPVRLLIFKDDFEKHSERLRAWALQANETLVSRDAHEIELDPSFPVLPHWRRWHRIFREDDYPDDADIDEVILGDETADKAVDRIAALVEVLDPLIPEVEDRERA